jgi:hypothetical protein
VREGDYDLDPMLALMSYIVIGVIKGSRADISE